MEMLTENKNDQFRPYQKMTDTWFWKTNTNKNVINKKASKSFERKLEYVCIEYG